LHYALTPTLHTLSLHDALPIYCTPISWDEAQPGDLVFYPGDEHVGIVGGRDANGDLMILHCTFKTNNVTVSGVTGFSSIARPNRSEEHTSELQSRFDLVCRLLL